jgi:hypothetical protein
LRNLGFTGFSPSIGGDAGGGISAIDNRGTAALDLAKPNDDSATTAGQAKTKKSGKGNK